MHVHCTKSAAHSGAKTQGFAMKFRTFGLLAVGLLSGSLTANAAMLGPAPYLSSADSPFSPFSGFNYFYLNDFEDGILNADGTLGTPGVTASGPGLCMVNNPCFAGSGLVDSVENGQQGHDLWANGYIEFLFDAAVLGALPNAVGIVWTDGVDTISFEAFDALNNSLGTLSANHADGTFTGGQAEDRFYGLTSLVGIARIRISDPSGIEVDHLQYGFRGDGKTDVPEPGALALLGLGLAGLGLTRRRKAN